MSDKLLPLSVFSKPIEILFTDIDDTLTLHGKLPPESYQALWDLQKAQIDVIPVTGRPAGWCEMIARTWPVSAVVGENGAFYFRYHNKKMQRYYSKDLSMLEQDKRKLAQIEEQVRKEIPKAKVSSDQFCRLFDLAIDFCEDIPRLTPEEIQNIVRIFEDHGAQAKISSIHVNGWFGDFNKLTTVETLLKKVYSFTATDVQERCGFSGDSPNDEPMFAFFKNSFGVSNIMEFKDQIQHLPTYLASKEGGLGFVEIADRLLQIKQSHKA